MPLSDFNYDGAFEGATVVVTGGAGFIGSHLAARLVELGAMVRILDDLSTGKPENVPAGATLIEASILDDNAVRDAMSGSAFVFHEAAMVSVPLSVEQPDECLRINTVGAHRVLEAAKEEGVDRVVFASSAAVYGGEPNLPSRETDPIDCWSPYAASKSAGEALMSAFGRSLGLSTVSLRYFNIFGPRQDPGSAYAAVISAFADALAKGESPAIFGDGTQTRDFTSVDNVVHANLLAASTERDLRGEVFNVGTGVQTSLLDLLEVMSRIAGVSVEPAFAEPRAGDVLHSCASIEKARAELGYDIVTPLGDGLKSLLKSLPKADSHPSPEDQSG